MAVINMTFRSACIHKTMEISVILPIETVLAKKSEGKSVKAFPTLYLLHGLTGNNQEWLHQTNIVRYAETKGFAVVMPNSWNRYYIDNPRTGESHGDYIAKEIVELSRTMFPLSSEREDTYIGGFSMGGYGAFRLGLKYPELFGGIISLAGGFRYKHMDRFEMGRVFAESPSFFKEVYGDLSQIKGSEIDLEEMVQRLTAENRPLPNIFLAVGTEDSLLEDERCFRDYLQANQVPLTYEEEAGKHDWDFADYFLSRGMDWWYSHKQSM